MADISTPTTARKTEDFTASQRQLVRDSLFIHDNPYQTEKTYIVFDADAGNNDLHLITGASSTYTITQGDGTQPVEYTDTGGTKVLNYAEAGRYLITISGTFNGINVTGAATAARDKYIAVMAGTNYPTSLAVGAFSGCSNLAYATFKSNLTSMLGSGFFATSLRYIEADAVTAIGDSEFGNTLLEIVSFPLLTTIGNSTFSGCENLKEVALPSLSTLDTNCFNNCVSLEIFVSGSVSSIPSSAFSGCESLVTVNMRNVTTIGNFAFNNCYALERCHFGALTNIGNDSFDDNFSLKTFIMEDYTTTSFGTTPFSNVNLSDLIIENSNATNAGIIQGNFSSAGCGFYTNYRLLY